MHHKCDLEPVSSELIVTVIFLKRTPARSVDFPDTLLLS